MYTNLCPKLSLISQLSQIRRTEVCLEVPIDGVNTNLRISQGGDMAAAHAGYGLDSPICQHGCCFRCTLGKCDWFDPEKTKTARRRNFVYQCCANHINPFKLMPGYENTPPPKCPHCEETLTDEFCAGEQKVWDDKSPNQRVIKRREHSQSHAGAVFLTKPLFVMDHRRRARSALHRRMNACANNIAVTFMKVKFSLEQRQRANVLLHKLGFLWRFPERDNVRAKTPTGNDARRFHTDKRVIPGLIQIFYPDEDASTVLPGIVAAADAAAHIMDVEEVLPVPLETIQEEIELEFEPGAEPAKGKRKAKPKSKGKAKGKGKGEGNGKGKQPAAKQPAANRKPAAKQPAAKKKRAVGDVAVGDGMGVTADTVTAYTEARRGQKRAAAEAVTSYAEEEDETPDPEDVEGAADVAPDESLLPDETVDEMEETLDTLEEDEEVGNVFTAVEVWRTSILHQADVHAKIADHFDMAQRRAYGEKGQASGRAWAIAVQEHSNYKAAWQYVHDSFAHFLEDAMEHGAAERVDDSILEKGNRRKKKLGLRCCFHGGTNREGAMFRQRRQIALKDANGQATGEMAYRVTYQKAVQGPSAQMQWLDLVGQTLEARRPSKRQKMSAKQLAAEEERKTALKESRSEVVKAVTELSEEKKKLCAQQR